MIDYTLQALEVLFQWPNPLYLIAGVLFGMVIGILPGMSGSTAIALLIPITLTMDPAVAVLFLMAANSPSGFGGMITSIIVNTPGDPENAATIFDGNPMAKQGRAGAAIGAGTVASVIGGLLGLIILLALLPFAQDVVLSFSYPEFFMMGILGISIIAILTESSFGKGLVAGALGLLLAFIGSDPINGLPRFTGGTTYLWDGVDIVPVLIGLFAGAEVLALFGLDQSIARAQPVSAPREKGRAAEYGSEVTFFDGVRSAFVHWRTIVRGSLVGTGVGMVPGAGGATAGFVAYASAMRASKHPQKFGKGAIEGVISVEAANDAKDGSTLLPTLAFGIPGTVAMAVLLSAFTMHGIDPGPTLILNHMDIVYVLLLSMMSAKFIAPFVVFFLSRYATRLTTMRAGLFAPIIVIAVLVGAYTLRLDATDAFVTVFFGYVGYAMLRYGYSRIALCIALVLGGLMERSYFQMSKSFETTTAIFARPISLLLIALTVLILVSPLLRRYSSRVRRARTPSGAVELPEASFEEGDALAADPHQRRQYGRIIFGLVILSFTSYILVDSFGLRGDAAFMPRLVAILILVIQAPIFITELFPRLRSADRGWRPWRRGSQSAEQDCSDEAPAEPVVPTPDGDLPQHSDGRDPAAGARLAVAKLESPTGVDESEDSGDSGELSTRQIFWRQVLIGVWSIGFILLGQVIGFITAIPVALFVFLRLVIRESYRVTLIVCVSMTLFLYLLFVVMLQQPL